jgi:hypothetical protein
VFGNHYLVTHHHPTSTSSIQHYLFIIGIENTNQYFLYKSFYLSPYQNKFMQRIFNVLILVCFSLFLHIDTTLSLLVSLLCDLFPFSRLLCAICFSSLDLIPLLGSRFALDLFDFFVFNNLY